MPGLMCVLLLPSTFFCAGCATIVAQIFRARSVLIPNRDCIADFQSADARMRAGSGVYQRPAGGRGAVSASLIWIRDTEDGVLTRFMGSKLGAWRLNLML